MAFTMHMKPSQGMLHGGHETLRLGLNRRSFDRRTLLGHTSSSRLFVQGVSRDIHVLLFWTCCLTVNKSLTSPQAPKKAESTFNRHRHQKRGEDSFEKASPKVNRNVRRFCLFDAFRRLVDRKKTFPKSVRRSKLRLLRPTLSLHGMRLHLSTI